MTLGMLEEQGGVDEITGQRGHHCCQVYARLHEVSMVWLYLYTAS